MIKHCYRCEQDRYVTHRWDILMTDGGRKVRLDNYTCITCGIIVESEQASIVFWVKTTPDGLTPVFKEEGQLFAGGSYAPVFYGPYDTWLDAFKKAKQIEYPFVEIEEGLMDTHAKNL